MPSSSLGSRTLITVEEVCADKTTPEKAIPHTMASEKAIRMSLFITSLLQGKHLHSVSKLVPALHERVVTAYPKTSANCH